MVKHSGRIPFGCILTAIVLEVADVFLFLGIVRNYRQPLFHEGLCLGVGFRLCRFLHAKGDGGTGCSCELAKGLNPPMLQRQRLNAQKLASLVLRLHGHNLGYPVLCHFIQHEDSVAQEVEKTIIEVFSNLQLLSLKRFWYFCLAFCVAVQLWDFLIFTHEIPY